MPGSAPRPSPLPSHPCPLTPALPELQLTMGAFCFGSRHPLPCHFVPSSLGTLGAEGTDTRTICLAPNNKWQETGSRQALPGGGGDCVHTRAAICCVILMCQAVGGGTGEMGWHCVLYCQQHGSPVFFFLLPLKDVAERERGGALAGVDPLCLVSEQRGYLTPPRCLW